MVVLRDCSSSSSSSSSYSPTEQWTYDVFLSFRGTDNRNNFTAYLYEALCRRGIRTYMDDQLKIGEEISKALLKAIESSSIAIIVLSKNYADSRWCLDELIKILECKEKKQQMVVPIFYNVEPSEVRNQTGSIGEAFAMLEARFMDDVKLQSWKRALKEVANLSGCHFRNRKEIEFIHEIIQKLEPRIVNQVYLDVAKYPVGIKSRVQQVNLLLKVGMNDIRMVGIVGAGGIGKTAIAKAIYNSIAYQFDGSCFLFSIRETYEERNGLVHLQNELLSKVLENSSSLVDIVDRGITMIKRSLSSKKVLIVLDDVDQSIQLEKLVGRCDWFGIGSRIIITTRDKGLLTKHGVDLMYQMDRLNVDEALELFSWNAFKNDKPHDNFVELTQQVVGYAGGIPLALEVMGSHLFNKSLREWNNIFDKYKVILHGDIEKILKVSYDGLDKEEKNIFLDIACFFKGRELDYVSKILDKCGFFADCGIQELVNKSLLVISKNHVEMHDLIQQMGREIVRQESPDDPGKRSRLWHHEDVRHVLQESTGTNKIEGILVALPKEEQIYLNPKVFKKMRKLRLFLNNDTTFSTTPSFLSNELRVLHWYGFPGEFLPSNFHGKNLIELIMGKSNFKTYEIIQNFRNLVNISFRECESLREVPDLSMIPNLERFNLIDCENLEKVHPSLASFDKLIRLSFHNCPNLKSFSRSLKLRSLLYLSISKCQRLRNFPEIKCSMEYLERVNLGDNNIDELPSSWKLSQCEHFDLSGCSNVENLLNIIYSSQSGSFIESTNVFNIGRSFPMASVWLSRIVHLRLLSTDIVSLPMCIQDCCQLRNLDLSDCRELKEISRLPPYLFFLHAKECVSLEKIQLDARESPWIKTMHLSNCQVLKDLVNEVQHFVLSEGHASVEEKHENHLRLDFSFPGYEIPNWFSYKKATGGDSCETDVIELPNLDWKIKGIAFCFVFRKQNTETAKLGNISWGIDVICGGLKIYSRSTHMLHSEWGNICFLSKSFESFKMKGDGMHVYLRYETKVPMFESWGVHLVRENEENATNSMSNPQDAGNIFEDVDDDYDAFDEGYLTYQKPYDGDDNKCRGCR